MDELARRIQASIEHPSLFTPLIFLYGRNTFTTAREAIDSHVKDEYESVLIDVLDIASLNPENLLQRGSTVFVIHRFDFVSALRHVDQRNITIAILDLFEKLLEFATGCVMLLCLEQRDVLEQLELLTTVDRQEMTLEEDDESRRVERVRECLSAIPASLDDWALTRTLKYRFEPLEHLRPCNHIEPAQVFCQTLAPASDARCLAYITEHVSLLTWRTLEAVLFRFTDQGLHAGYRFSGRGNLIREIQQRLIYPLLNPHNPLIRRQASRGIVLIGASGSGKSVLALQVQARSPVNWISIQATEVFSKYFGETERVLRSTFQEAKVSRRPTVIYIDGVDILGQRRGSLDTSGVAGRVLSTLLNELDGVSAGEGVAVLATACSVHNMDDALLRPGRLDHHIEIPLPSADDREAMIRFHAPKLGPSDLERLAVSMEGMMPAQIEKVVRYERYKRQFSAGSEGGDDETPDAGCILHFAEAMRERESLS